MLMRITEVRQQKNKHLVGQVVKILKKNVTSKDKEKCHKVQTASNKILLIARDALQEVCQENVLLMVA